MEEFPESSFIEEAPKSKEDENNINKSVYNDSDACLLRSDSSPESSCKLNIEDEKFADSAMETSDGNIHVKMNPMNTCTSKWIQRLVIAPRHFLNDFLSQHKNIMWKVFNIILFIGVTVYMVFSALHDLHKALPLIVIYILVVIFKTYAFLQSRKLQSFKRFSRQLLDFYENHEKLIIGFAVCVLIGLLALWIIMDTLKRPKQLISLVGYFVFLFVLFIASKHPQHVTLRPVMWGCLLQVLLAFFVLRTPYGFSFFNFLGALVQTFINYVDVGVQFVFGQSYFQHFFAFKVLSIVIYFSSFISILYYLGAMQWLILKISWIMQRTLNTSPTESMVAAGNIFVGQTEAPLLIRPYINDLTTSELHSVMVCGFGTVSGSVLGAYLSFGIEPVYVITACVMAAPCALAVSKLVFPETKTSAFGSSEGLQLEKGKQRNIIEAAFEGASQAIPLVLNIAANLIAFLALLAALNGFLEWFSSLTGYHVNFQIICSYLFFPIALLLGVDTQFASKVAELIGTKVFINEFIAYEKLSEMITRRDNGTWEVYNSTMGEVNWVDERSEAIVTYALCGFANVGSLGIMLGGLGSLAPKRQSEMAKIVLRALICGVFVSILNACIAGFLYEPRAIECGNILSQTNFSTVVPMQYHRLFECCSRDNSTGLFTDHTRLSRCLSHSWPSNYNYTSAIGDL